MLPPPPWIRLQRNIFFFTSFEFSKRLKNYHFYVYEITFEFVYECINETEIFLFFSLPPEKKWHRTKRKIMHTVLYYTVNVIFAFLSF